MIKDGILNINKPQDWTSFDVVKLLKRITGQKRTGHTGTLDPMATGVLPVCFGPATRIMEYLDLDFKTYQCSMKLGFLTDTLDIWGETLAEKSYEGIKEEDINKAFKEFKGTILQIPPKYSAIKVNGRKLYDYARSGEEVEIKPRKVYIKDISVTAIDLKEGKISFKCICSKGTYIRSICRDVGERLGTYASMNSLTRVSTGAFDIENAVDIEEIRNWNTEDIEKLIVPVEDTLIHFGEGLVDGYGSKWFSNGGWLEKRRVKVTRAPEFENMDAEIEIQDKYRRMYNIFEENEEGKEFIGTAVFDIKENMYIPDKIFKR